MAPIQYTVPESREYKIPATKRDDALDDVIDPSSIEDLPRGIILTGGAKLRAQNLTGHGVKVAVIDSGVDADHDGFNGKVTKQVWFRWGTPLEKDDHGTHVAGTIHMMAPDAEIYDYRVFGEDGWDVDEAISTSIYEACFDGVDIINMSLGGRWPSTAIRTAVEYASKQGVIIVCAAGNEGDGDEMTIERSYPALWDEAISIGAVSKVQDLATISFSNTNPQVDYAGIGVDVLSFKPGGGFQKMSGTSMACPHVCGLLAALMDKDYKNPFMGSKADRRKRDRKIRRFLKSRGMVLDIGLTGPDNSTGLGFLTYLTKNEFDDMW